MKGLVPLSDNPPYLDRYQAIRDSKRATTRNPLTASHAVIAAQYLRYEHAVNTNTLEAVPQSAQALTLSAPLRACYAGATKPLQALKKAIKETQPKRQLKYCPMCGTTTPGTFDHYMPAVRFPEFSVHPLNLVPCCSTCNSIKDDDWLDAAGSRQYLHAYSDTVPDLQFLKVSLHQDPALNGVGATFSLIRPANIAPATWSIIHSHFDRLHLVLRYNELGNDEIAGILSTCEVFLQESGKISARAFLAGLAAQEKAIYGRNDWRVVLMETMASHPDFDGWVQP